VGIAFEVSTGLRGTHILIGWGV